MNLPIFYDPRQSLKGVNSYSPSADKPERFMDAIPAHFGSPYIQPVVPVTQDDLKLAHHPAYVDGIFNGSILNGFDNNDLRVAESCLWTCGSMLSAARNAVKTGQSACSPTSGFHHAGYADGGGFCTFNGLMVTVAKLTKDNPDVRVGILDCDYHYGDGTADILAHVIHPNVLHRTSGKRFYSPDDTVKAFMDWLYESIDALNAFACDVVLYQAGADMHRMDPHWAAYSLTRA